MEKIKHRLPVFLALMIVMLSRSAFSGNLEKDYQQRIENAFARTYSIMKSDLIPTVQEIEKRFLSKKHRLDATGEQSALFERALVMLARTKLELQALGDIFSGTDDRGLNEIFSRNIYHTYLDSFYFLTSIYFQSNTQLQAYAPYLLRNFELVTQRLSKNELCFQSIRILNDIYDVQAQTNVKAFLFAYERNFDVRDLETGGFCLFQSNRAVLDMRYSNFLTYPSVSNAKQLLKIEALRHVYAVREMYDLYTYSDEKFKDFEINRIRPVEWFNQSPAKYLTTHAAKLMQEGEFRKGFPGGKIQRTAEEILKGTQDFGEHFRALILRVDNLLRLIQIARPQLRAYYEKRESIKSIEELKEDKYFPFLKSEKFSRQVLEAIKRSPYYLSELNPDQFVYSFVNAFKVTYHSFVLYFLAENIFGIPGPVVQNFIAQLSPLQTTLIKAYIESFIESTLHLDLLVTANEIPPEHEAYVSQIKEKLYYVLKASEIHPDISVSVNRYEFAANYLLKAVETMERIESLKESADLYKKAYAKLPKSLEPNPNFLIVLSSYLQLDHAEVPAWFLESIEKAIGIQNGTKGKIKGSELKNHLLHLPEELEPLLSKLKGLLEHADVITHLKLIHEKLSKKETYRWASFNDQLQQMKVANLSIKGGAVLDILIKLYRYGAQFLGPKFQNEIHLIFKKEVLEEQTPIEYAIKIKKEVLNSGYGVNELLVSLGKVKTFIYKHRIIIEKSFSSEKERSDIAAELLVNPDVFDRYLKAYATRLKQVLPILFKEIHLSQEYAGQTLRTDAIPLWVLISKVKRALKALDGGQKLAVEAVNALHKNKKYAQQVSKGHYLNSKVETPLSLNMIMNHALRSIQHQKITFKDKLIGWAFEMSDEARKSAPINGNTLHWPKYLKVRDVYPAIEDRKSSPIIQAERMLVSTLLSPYVRDANEKSYREEAELLNPKADHSELLSQSAAYDAVVGNLEGRFVEGFKIFQEEALERKINNQFYKSVTGFFQEGAHYVFQATFWLHNLIPPALHKYGGYYMCVASLADLIVDGKLLWEDYWTDYSSKRMFANPGLFQRGLVAMDDLHNAKEAFHQNAEIFIDRIPMDIPFYAATAYGVAAGRLFERSLRAARPEVERLGKNWDQFKDDYGILQMQLGHLYKTLGVKPEQYPPSQLPELYAKKFKPDYEERLQQGGLRNEGVPREMEQWEHTVQTIQAFKKEYGEGLLEPQKLAMMLHMQALLEQQSGAEKRQKPPKLDLGQQYPAFHQVLNPSEWPQQNIKIDGQ